MWDTRTTTTTDAPAMAMRSSSSLRSLIAAAAAARPPAARSIAAAAAPARSEPSPSPPKAGDHPAVTRRLNRFWSAVSVGVAPDGSLPVLLDGRPVRTPAGAVLAAPPSRPILASLVASEWQATPSNAPLRPHALPLSSILVRSIDGNFANDPDARTKVIDAIMPYLTTDTVCYRQSFPDSFVKLQTKHWDPVVAWAHSHLGNNICIICTDGITAVKHPESTISLIRNHIASKAHADPIYLAALEIATMRSKSLLIALMLLHGDLLAKDAATAARLEVLHQISKWGEVEDSHDTDREDLIRLLSASAIAALCR